MFRFLIAAFVSLFPLIAQADNLPTCTGRNLLDDLQKSDPATYGKVMTEADATPNGQAIFWKIEGKGKVKPSWLYGTAHLTDPRINRLAPGAEQAIAHASVLALELKEAVSAQRLAAAMMARARFMAMPPGQHLWDVIDDADEAAIKANPNFPADRAAVLDAYQPWVVATMLNFPKCEQARQAAGRFGVDQTIAQKAMFADVEVVGLETVDEQIGLFANMPMATQVKYLVAMAKSGPMIDDYVETMVQLYQHRKLAALTPLTKVMKTPGSEDLELMTFFEDDLIKKRNRIMEDRAAKLIDKGNAFIAVGALHLVGREGLVELLRKAGYKVTPVN